MFWSQKEHHPEDQEWIASAFSMFRVNKSKVGEGSFSWFHTENVKFIENIEDVLCPLWIVSSHLVIFWMMRFCEYTITLI